MTAPNHTPDVAHATVAANERSSVMIRELTSGDIHRLQRHFLALGEEDRLLRFGQAVTDDVITRYVASLDFSRDSVLKSPVMIVGSLISSACCAIVSS